MKEKPLSPLQPLRNDCKIIIVDAESKGNPSDHPYTPAGAIENQSVICITPKVASSARRWEQNGIYRTMLLMWSLRLRYFFGANPRILATLYSRGQFWKP